ncbi:hypothetical protein DICA4_E29140 [Diutina catenulata]
MFSRLFGWFRGFNSQPEAPPPTKKPLRTTSSAIFAPDAAITFPEGSQLQDLMDLTRATAEDLHRVRITATTIQILNSDDETTSEPEIISIDSV